MNRSPPHAQPTHPPGGRDPWAWAAGRPMLWVPPLALALLAAYPPLSWHALAWVALAPLLAGLRMHRAAASGGVAGWATAGWLWGLVFWGAQYAWTHETLVVQAGMAPLHFANLYGLLVALLALLPAAWCAGARWAWLRWGWEPGLTVAVALAAQSVLLGAWPFGGLAWGDPAGPQAHTLAARVVVPLLGGAGLVLLLVGVNAAWARLLPAAASGGRHRARSAAALALLTAITAAGAWPAPPPRAQAPPAQAPRGSQVETPQAPAPHPEQPPPRETPLTALLVPGDLSVAALRAARRGDAGAVNPVRYYLARTAAAAPAGAGEPSARPTVPPRAVQPVRPVLAIWPESAVPGDVARGKALPDLSRMAGLLGLDLLLGSNARVRGRDRNAVYLVHGARFDFQRYDKRRLVPFGEYVPRGFRWLFGKKATAGEADLAPGTAPPVLPWQGQRLGLAICFESILPGHVADALAAGAEVLVAVANDAWLTPAARVQHRQLTALRGLEVGRDVLLVANRGETAHLRGGTMLSHSRGGAPLLVRARPRSATTVYGRWGHGPLLALCAVLALGAVGLRGGAARRAAR